MPDRDCCGYGRFCSAVVFALLFLLFSGKDQLGILVGYPGNGRVRP